MVTTIIVMPLRPSPSSPPALRPRVRVEGAGGLVEQQQSRFHGERAGDGDALLLTAGHLPGVGVSRPARPTRSSSARARTAPAARHPRTATGASVMFSSTVMCGKRLNCWKTMPTWARCRVIERARSSCSRAPSCGSRRCHRQPRRIPRRLLQVVTQRSSVDLPEPEAPSRTVTSPRARRGRSRPGRAGCRSSCADPRTLTSGRSSPVMTAPPGRSWSARTAGCWPW